MKDKILISMAALVFFMIIISGCTKVQTDGAIERGEDGIEIKNTAEQKATAEEAGKEITKVSEEPIKPTAGIPVTETPSASQEDILSGQQGAEGGIKITADELAQHDSPSDCWIVYEKKIYDITDPPSHPNMAKAFFRHCGKISGFEEGAKSRHSGRSSAERVENYASLIGELI
ncbi:hypothetical protein KY358_01985 [Candidatus Woesearchaeota archaeon]|nr:hypothetical protein [Candidatus Woesearchaeota archaeon]